LLSSVSIIILYYCFFFFSSRRRHTRFSRDWSSDVCSSDLAVNFQGVYRELLQIVERRVAGTEIVNGRTHAEVAQAAEHVQGVFRSEERRVGKEGRARWASWQ